MFMQKRRRDWIIRMSKSRIAVYIVYHYSQPFCFILEENATIAATKEIQDISVSR